MHIMTNVSLFQNQVKEVFAIVEVQAIVTFRQITYTSTTLGGNGSFCSQQTVLEPNLLLSIKHMQLVG